MNRMYFHRTRAASHEVCLSRRAQINEKTAWAERGKPAAKEES